ncbi:MAG: TatD family hydrolase [Phycisphaerales bacterium]|nr:TatD family hydrolase [Phycisphaerales bacterium]
MRLIDTHAHLTYPGLFERIDEVMQHCAEAGVECVITIGTDVDEAHKGLELARRFPGRVRVAAGFHPHGAAKVGSADWSAMEAVWAEPELVAFGEMGLDYHYDFAPRDAQQAVFARQLQLAAARDLPIIIHSREAFEDVRSLLLEHGYKDRRVVFHCFTGTEQEAAAIAECGWRISFTGIVTFKNSTALQAIARAYPADRLMIETDSPYLAPVPVRSQKTNEPANVAHTASFLAALRGVGIEQLAAETTRNAEAFFALA